ncbi:MULTISPECIES: hypothetical protein [Bacillati]|uniref:hypothetical protein n=1 Tax=Bacillati TaxID=1783272 RepID=UPI00342B82B3
MSELSRLDGAMNARRLELGLAWKDVARVAGISYETLRGVRRGSTAGAALTLRRIERALQWAQGSIDAVMAGGEATPLGDAVQADQPAAPEPSVDPRVDAVMTILDGLPRRVQAQVLRRLGDRLDELMSGGQ